MFKRKIILRQIYIYNKNYIIQWRIPRSKLHKIRKGAGLVVFNFFWNISYAKGKWDIILNCKINMYIKNRLLKMLACVTTLEIATCIFNGRKHFGMVYSR